MQKVEKWNGHEIRFVFHDEEYWAVLSDIATALELRTDKVRTRLGDDHLSRVVVKDKAGRKQLTLIVNEFGIYEAVFSSRKPEAKAFKRWVFEVIKELRQSAGLEVFQLLDREHQKKAMAKLTDKKPVNYIKANQIANKATSNAYGFEKSLKKSEMNQEMLVTRQTLLADTVDLMNLKEKYGLDLSVSQTIYNKDSQKELA